MAQGFFTYIDETPDPNVIDLQAVLASLSGATKLQILDAFANDDNPFHVDRSLIPVHRGVLVMLFNVLGNIRDDAGRYTRGEVITGYGPPDPDTGIEPPIYNVVPISGAQLITIIQGIEAYADVFTNAAIGVIVNKMLLWSKIDNTGTFVGTFTTYSENV